MDNRLLGALGEQTAGRYLREHGYTICASNYKTAVGELDIVAEKDETLCVVEVKTRQTGGFLPPSAAVDARKQENLRNCAAAYVAETKTKCNVRFDIVEVLVENGKVTDVRHLENAF